jgi:SAM-dependent methyltransferase
MVLGLQLRSRVSSIALTTTEYWDGVWLQTAIRREVPRIERQVYRHHARMFALFGRWLGRRKRFLEIGAGGSAWPAEVAERFGAEAWGIDNSAAGLALTERAAAALGQRVHLVEGDVFDPTLLPRASFDVVYSGGFVEHFTDPHVILRRLAQLVAPAGVLVTSVPNFCGLNGLLQRVLDAECLAQHVIYDPIRLDRAHLKAGLWPLERAHWEGVLDLSYVEMTHALARLPHFLRSVTLFAIAKSRQLGDGLASSLGIPGGGRWLAPALMGVYRPVRA